MFYYSLYSGLQQRKYSQHQHKYLWAQAWQEVSKISASSHSQNTRAYLIWMDNTTMKRSSQSRPTRLETPSSAPALLGAK